MCVSYEVWNITLNQSTVCKSSRPRISLLVLFAQINNTAPTIDLFHVFWLFETPKYIHYVSEPFRYFIWVPMGRYVRTDVNLNDRSLTTGMYWILTTNFRVLNFNDKYDNRIYWLLTTHLVKSAALVNLNDKKTPGDL